MLVLLSAQSCLQAAILLSSVALSSVHIKVVLAPKRDPAASYLCLHRFLNGMEVELLAQWVWTSFHPGQKMDSTTLCVRYFIFFYECAQIDQEFGYLWGYIM